MGEAALAVGLDLWDFGGGTAGTLIIALIGLGFRKRGRPRRIRPTYVALGLWSGQVSLRGSP